MRLRFCAPLAAASLLASAAVAAPDAQSFSNDHGWALSINKAAHQCELSTIFPGDDGQQFIMLVPRPAADQVSFAFVGDTFHGAPGTLSFIFDGRPSYSVPVETVQEQSVGSRLPTSFLVAFKASSRLEIRLNDRVVARLILTGSAPAISHLAQCSMQLGQRG